jgi:predicted glycoside hydrolase/deacetylase ChbG (UPF0249 family)
MVEQASLTAGLRRLIQWTGLAVWSRLFASRFLASACRVVPSLGFLPAGGRLTRNALLNTLIALRAKESCRTVEVMLHPGTGDAHTLWQYRHWGYDWEQDLRLLTDPALEEALALYGIQTTSFGKEL